MPNRILILRLGLLALLLCALFPPRRHTKERWGGQYQIGMRAPRGFLLWGDVQRVLVQVGGDADLPPQTVVLSHQLSWVEVEIDLARLLAEWVVLGSLTALFCLGLPSSKVPSSRTSHET